MEDKKMKFHITVTDNETGEKLHDSDACAIIGAFNDGEYTQGLGSVYCGAEDILFAVEVAEEVIEGFMERHPELLLLRFLGAKAAADETDADEETEDK